MEGLNLSTLDHGFGHNLLSLVEIFEEAFDIPVCQADISMAFPYFLSSLDLVELLLSKLLVYSRSVGLNFRLASERRL